MLLYAYDDDDTKHGSNHNRVTPSPCTLSARTNCRLLDGCDGHEIADLSMVE